MAEDAVVPEMVLNITEVARQKVFRVRANESEPETLALWLEIAGVADGKYKYDMYFQPIDYAGPTDVVQRHDDLSVVIPAFSVDKVRGATLDVQGDPVDGGLVLDNPNSPSPVVGTSARPPADLSGDVAQRVLQVLDSQINPSIASHGGHAELVAVEEDTAYFRLSGGCPGCGMASVAPRPGVAGVIKEAGPRVTKGVRVARHGHRGHPFF